MREYLRQQELAERLKLSVRSLERWRLEGKGPKFVRAGRRVLYRDTDVEEWLQAHTFGSTGEGA